MIHNQGLSHLRLELRRRHEDMGVLLAGLLQGGPLMEGSIYNRRRRCGKPRCRCQRGLLHRDRVLAVRRGRRVVARCLDALKDVKTEDAVAAWRLFRRRRHELAQACRLLLGEVDRLGRLRQVRAGGPPSPLS